MEKKTNRQQSLLKGIIPALLALMMMLSIIPAGMLRVNAETTPPEPESGDVYTSYTTTYYRLNFGKNIYDFIGRNGSNISSLYVNEHKYSYYTSNEYGYVLSNDKNNNPNSALQITNTGFDQEINKIVINAKGYEELVIYVQKNDGSITIGDDDTPEEGSVTGVASIKIQADEASQRSGESIVADIYQGSKLVKEVTLDSSNQWTTTFGDGDLYSNKYYIVKGIKVNNGNSDVTDQYKISVAKSNETEQILSNVGWKEQEKGTVENGNIHVFAYEKDGKYYLLGRNDSDNVIIAKSPDGFPSVEVDNNYKWEISEAKDYYNEYANPKYLKNLGNGKYLYYSSDKISFYATTIDGTKWSVDSDGSIWHPYNYSYKQLKISDSEVIISDDCDEFIPYVYQPAREYEQATYTITTSSAAHTVTFVANGHGTAPANMPVNDGDKITEPKAPEEPGFEFGGWYKDKDCNEGNKFDFNTAITTDITLFAKWIPVYTVTFDSNDGTEVKPVSVTQGKKVSKPADPEREGYTFGGWFPDESYKDAFDFDNSLIESNITLYAKWTPDTYTVTFDSDGGTTIASATVNYNEKINKPSEPTKSGYSFVHWADKTTNKEYNFDTPVTGDVDLIAVWTQKLTPVPESADRSSENVDKAIYKTETDSDYLKEISEISVNGNTFSKESSGAESYVAYNNNHWYVNTKMAYIVLSNSDTAYPARITVKANGYADADFMINENGQITKPASGDNVFTVTFESNGGNKVGTQTISSGNKVTQPGNVKKADYNLEGWYIDAGLTQKWSFDTATVSENITLYAKWEEIIPDPVEAPEPEKADIDTYNSRGTDVFEYKAADAAYLSNITGISVQAKDATEKTDFTKVSSAADAGFTHDSWSTEGTKLYVRNNYDYPVIITVQAKGYKDKSFKVTKAGKILAPEEKDSFTVTFDVDDHGTAPEAQTISAGSVATEPSAPKVDGYRFDGWYTDENPDAAAKPFNFNGTAIDKDVTLYAKWTKLYKVTFDSNEGSSVESAFVAEGEKALRPTEVPRKEGYRFLGWYKDQQGQQEWNFGTDIVSEDTTIFAKWEQIEYTVTFDPNGGAMAEGAEKQQVKYGYKATKPEKPQKEGHTFDKWVRYIEGEATDYDFDTPVTETITLVALWTKNPEIFTVTFDADGGSTVAEQTVEENETATKPEAPTKDGYTFKEWQLDGIAYDFSKPVTGSITLKAVWEEKAKEPTPAPDEPKKEEPTPASDNQDKTNTTPNQDSQGKTDISSSQNSQGKADNGTTGGASGAGKTDVSSRSQDKNAITPTDAAADSAPVDNTLAVVNVNKIGTTASVKNKTMKISLGQLKGVDNCRIYYKKVGAKKWTSLWSGGKNSVTIKKLKKNGLYQFQFATYKKKNGSWVRGNASSISYRWLINTKISKVTAAKKSLKIKWKKTKGASGYMIRYATDKKFKKNVGTITVKGGNKTAKVIRKLKKGKRYYVQIRPYKMKGGKKYQGVLSASKKVKVR